MYEAKRALYTLDTTHEIKTRSPVGETNRAQQKGNPKTAVWLVSNSCDTMKRLRAYQLFSLGSKKKTPFGALIRSFIH